MPSEDYLDHRSNETNHSSAKNLTYLDLTDEFNQALPIMDTLLDAGYEAYFVGGSVRDALLGLPVNDVDIATSARPEEVKTLFKKTVDVGIEHGTVMVLHKGASYEITTFRTESTYQDHRRPDSVDFVRSLEEDLKRRDFTINALAIDRDGKITDLFHGLEDLDNQVIRAVGEAGERFNEDALRLMRAVRFSAQLGFEIEAKTKQAITRNASLLSAIAVERIHIEWIKLLLSKNRQAGLKAMIETKLFNFCPELSNKKLALTYLITNPHRFESEAVAWSMLLYYIRYLQPKNHKESVAQFLKSWKASNHMIQSCQILLEGLEKRLKPENKQVDAYDVYLNGLDNSLTIETLLEMVGQDSQADSVKRIYQNLPILSRQELSLSGNDLMQAFDKKPGPWLGQALKKAEKQVVYGNWPNDKAELIHLLSHAI